MNKPVLDPICKNSAAFVSSLPVKPITAKDNYLQHNPFKNQ
tara:strand:+ start:106 stop:228 length:123 start_codon:yes stop_codon:yes gene_type:complete